MTAAQQVFDVAELLEIIICQCAPHQIRELKQVARAWRNAITTSNAIRRATVETPLSFGDLVEVQHDLLAAFFHRQNASVYRSTSWIRLNPILDCAHYAFECDYLGASCYTVTIVLPDTIETGLDEHITHPPIPRMTLTTTYWDSENGHWIPHDENPNICTAYTPRGLKIKDLLAVRDALRAAQEKYIGEDDVVSDDCMIQACFEVQGKSPDAKSVEDRKLDKFYFHGPPPRYRKASHGAGLAAQEAMQRDRLYEWHPLTGTKEDKLSYQPEWMEPDWWMWNEF